MTDPKAAGAALVTAFVAWVFFRHWLKAYRTGVLNNRWGPASRASNQITYRLSMTYGAVVLLLLAAVSVGLMLIAFGIIDGQRVW